MRKSILLVGCAVLAMNISSAQILTEGFESGMPGTWTLSQAGGSAGWLTGNASSMGSQYFGIPEHGNFACSNDDACNCDMSADMLQTPVMDLTGNTSIYLTFDAYHTAEWGSSANVNISTDGGSTFSTLTSITGGFSWQSISVDLSSYTSSNQVVLQFHHNDNGQWGDGFAIDNVKVFAPVALDMAGVLVDVPPMVSIEKAPFYIPITLQNVGTSTINDFWLKYSVNNGPERNMYVSSANVAAFASYSGMHGTSWTPAATGTYTIDVWAENLNGSNDGNTSNDIASVTVEVVDVIKRPLIEDFGSSTCPPCAALAVTFDPLLDANLANANDGNVTAIKYQMNWPPPGNDPYYNPDGVTRRTYYNVTGIPDTWANGSSMTQTTQAGIDAAIEEGFMKIDATYSISGNQVTANVTVDPITDFTSNNLRLHIVVVEDQYTFTGATTSQTEYSQVERKMMPDGNGTSIGPLTGGTPVTVNESYTFTIGGVAQGNHNIGSNLGNISVVAFVQDQATMEVHQSTSANWATSVSEFYGTTDVKVFPNPFNDVTNIKVNMEEDSRVSMEVYNILGEKVFAHNYGTMGGSQLIQFDGSNLNAGLYFMNIKVNDRVISKKVTLTK